MKKQLKYCYNWPRPMVTVDAIVFNVSCPEKLLPIKRGKEPFKGMWALPGGFVEMNEELKDAAGRELKEETGLEKIMLEQMHTFGKCGRDPRGRNITVAFIGLTDDSNAKIRHGDDAACAKWFEITNLPDMAFDHNEVAEIAIEKFRSMHNPNSS